MIKNSKFKVSYFESILQTTFSGLFLLPMKKQKKRIMDMHSLTLVTVCIVLTFTNNFMKRDG